MLYHCDGHCCHYTFFAHARLCRCPDCGGLHIRPASQPEIADYLREHPQAKQAD